VVGSSLDNIILVLLLVSLNSLNLVSNTVTTYQ